MLFYLTPGDARHKEGGGRKGGTMVMPNELVGIGKGLGMWM